MADPRYAIPLDELVAGVQVAREQQVVEVPTQSSLPAPAAVDPLPYGDGMSGDADGD